MHGVDNGDGAVRNGQGVGKAPCTIGAVQVPGQGGIVGDLVGLVEMAPSTCYKMCRLG